MRGGTPSSASLPPQCLIPNLLNNKFPEWGECWQNKPILGSTTLQSIVQKLQFVIHCTCFFPPCERCQQDVRTSQVLSESNSAFSPLKFHRVLDFRSPSPLLSQLPGALSSKCAHGYLLLFPWGLIIDRGCAQRYKEIIRRAEKMSPSWQLHLPVRQ